MTVAPSSMHPRRRLWVGPLVVVALAVATVVLALVFRNNVVVGGSSTSTFHGSGVAATETRTLPSFDSVELTGSNVVTIHAGRARSVVVHADDNLLHRITTTVTRHRLLVGNRPGSVHPTSPLSVDVTVPRLHAVELSGSGVISAEGITAPALSVILSGSGVIHASGNTSRLDVQLTGSGDAQLQQLVAARVHATVAGSGRILVDATTTLHASIPGSGAVVYSGSPRRVTTEISGSGAVTHG